MSEAVKVSGQLIWKNQLQGYPGVPHPGLVWKILQNLVQTDELKQEEKGSGNILQRKNEIFQQWPPEAHFTSTKWLLNGSPEQDATA